MNNTVAVIVTHNRLALLKEAIEALRAQSFPLKKIIIVNNGSTDNTALWLGEQQGLTVISQPNMGGSGGFYTGIKHAVSLFADWIWLMDDDTICSETALQKLLEKIPVLGAEKIGFISSKVTWKDGFPHKMNLPDLKTFYNETPFNSYDQHNILLVQSCSFVSVLVNTDAIKKIGLPYRDFYIWGDDQEYTRRIIKAGYLGIYCADSIALHKTASNHRAFIYTDSSANLWKHAHGFRNEFFVVRRDKGYIYYLLYMVARVSYGSYRIIKMRKANRLQFIKVLFSSAWKSLFFNPKIDMV